MLCLNITSEGYARLAEGDVCQYVLLTVQEHTKLTDISIWFEFDNSTFTMSFGFGLIIWVAGFKLGSIACVIVGAKRGYINAKNQCSVPQRLYRCCRF